MMFIRWQLHLTPRAIRRRCFSAELVVIDIVVEAKHDDVVGRATCASMMIKRSQTDADQAAVIKFENLLFVLAAKNEVFVLKRHSTRLDHFLTI